MDIARGGSAPLATINAHADESAGAAEAAAQVVPLEQRPAYRGLNELMGDIFNKHKLALDGHAPGSDERNMINQHNAGIDHLISSRAGALCEQGETRESVQNTLAKAGAKDLKSGMAAATFRGLPSAIDTVFQHFKPEIAAGAFLPEKYKAFAPLVSGAMSLAADTLGTTLANKAAADNQYLQAPADKLSDAMSAVLAGKTSAPQSPRATHNGPTAQRSSLINEQRGRGAITSLNHPKLQNALHVGLRAGTGLATDAGNAARMQTMDKLQGRTGPEFLFGRKDDEWLSAYNSLKNSGTSSQLGSMAKRGVQMLPAGGRLPGLKSRL